MSVKCRDVRSITDVFKSELPTLVRIKKEYGNSFTEKYISAWIINIIDFFQVGKKMGDQQVYETSMMILDEYWMLNLADINLVFQRAKKGHYGELYDRLDGAIILSWFRKYFEERCQSAESISMREHDQYKKSVDNTRSSGKAKDLIKQATHRYQKELLQKQV